MEFPPNLKPLVRLNEKVELSNRDFRGYVYDYPDAPELVAPDYPLFRGIFPTWDNTSRRKGTATIVVGSTPEKYGKWLGEVCHYTLKHLSGDRRLVFINAWNEWGEGCHLEPDVQFGRSYLEKSLEVFVSSSRKLRNWLYRADTRAMPEEFDEALYLSANPDVAAAVRSGDYRDGY